jgi:hypothetical protein
MSSELFHEHESSGNSSNSDQAAAKSSLPCRRDGKTGWCRGNETIDLQPFVLGKESMGYVVTLKEDFGFVKCGFVNLLLSCLYGFRVP